VEISEVQVWVYPGGPNIDPNYNPFCTRTNEGTRYCLPIAMTRYELGDDVVDDIAVIVKIKNRSSVRIDESLKLKVHLKLFKPGDEDSALEYESSYLQIDPYATTGPLFMNMDKIEEIFKYSSGVEIRAYLTWNDEESTIFTADYLNDRRNRFEKTKYIFSGWDYSLGGLKDNWWPAENLRSKYLLYTFPDKQHFDNFLTKYGLMTPLQEMCEYAMDCLEDIAIAYANETTKGLWGDFLDGVNRNVDPEELEKKLDNIAGEIAGAVSGLGDVYKRQ